jgi:hypothetical protein
VDNWLSLDAAPKTAGTKKKDSFLEGKIVFFPSFFPSLNAAPKTAGTKVLC